MKMRFVLSLVLIALLSVGTAFTLSCGESESEKAQETYDEDVQDLKDAVGELQNPDTYDSLASLEAAFRDVETSFNDAVSSGKDVADAKISEVQDAYGELKDDINDIDSDQTLGQKIDAVTDAVQKFADQLEQI